MGGPIGSGAVMLFPWGAGGRSTCADGSAYTSVPIPDPRALSMPRPRDSNDLFKYLYWFQKMKCAVVIHDVAGRVLWSNRYADAVYGTSMFGLQVYDIISPKFQALARFRIAATVRDGFIPGDIEIEYRASDGSPLWLRTTSMIGVWRAERCVMAIAENKTSEHQYLLYIYNLVEGVLSDREWEFIHLRAHSLSHGEIAKKWKSTPGSVKNYPGKIKKKLGLDAAGYSQLLEFVYFSGFYND